MNKQTAEDQAPEQLDLDTQAADEQAQPDAEPENPVDEAREFLAKGGSKAQANDEDQADDEDADDEVPEDEGDEEAADEEGKGQQQKEGDSQPDDADEDLAAMPEDVRERTRQRFEKLNQGYQELNQQYQTVTQDHQTLVKAIAETGMDSQQFSQVLDYVSALNSNDPRDLQYARDALNAQLREINLRLGDEDTLLDGHADLKEAVEYEAMSREHALELAKARTQQQRMQQQASRTPEAPAQQAQPEIEISQETIQRLDDLTNTWRRTDLAFEKKWAMMMDGYPESGRLVTLYQRTRPEALEQAVQEEWDRIGKELSAQQQPKQRSRSQHRPLSGGGTGAQGAVDHKDPIAGARAYLADRMANS